MRTTTQIAICTLIGVTIFGQPAVAQKIDTERLQRDIAVSENVLGTLIKHQFNNQRTFFSLEINGNYQPGYGVTFTLPADYTTPIVFMQGSQDGLIWNGNRAGQVNFNYDERDPGETMQKGNDESDSEKSITLKDKINEKRPGLTAFASIHIKVIEEPNLLATMEFDRQLGLQKKDRTNQEPPRAW